MRCKACDSIIDRPLFLEREGKVVEDPYCPECRDASEEDYDYLDHEFLFEWLTDGPTAPLKVPD